MNKEMAEYVLAEKGYNWALSDTEEACEFLDHPELKPEDVNNYHKWAEPYPRRCYCSLVGYTDKGRYYTHHMSEGHIKILKKCFPDKEFHDRFGELYTGAKL